MKISILYAVMILSLGLSTAVMSDIELASGGKAKAVIVLGADAIPAERTAARELATYLRKSTGAEFTITDEKPVSGTCILIGQTAYVKAMLKGFDWQRVKRDGIIIKTSGHNLILAGDRPRGSIYAVDSFLENQLGIRWWAPDAETVPANPDLSVSHINLVYKPPFMYREAFYQAVNTDNVDFPMHLKLNGHHQRIPADKGGHYSILGWCHTFYALLPPDKYFAAHPEWYAEIDGKRTDNWAQLCLTNPEMKEEMVKQALKWISENPDAGIISISQNDCFNPCQCPNCTALVKKTGSQSGALITFVNSVAEEIEKQYPDFLVETPAYQYTRQAPTGVKPRKNVIVRLCSIECNFGQPLDGKTNEAFYKDLQDWKKISERLYVWDYTVNFSNSFIPHPNFMNLAPNVRIFAKNNVVGLFEQGDAYNPSAALNPLKTWMLAKLMWNPKCNDKSLITEFMNGYYGDAGPYMEAYLNVLTDAVKKKKPYLSCFMTNTAYYSIGDLNKANEAMNMALNAVKDNTILLKRVKIQQMALNNLLIITRRSFSIKGQEVKGVGWDNIAGNFLKLADETGNIYYREGAPMDTEYRRMLSTKVVVPKFVKSALSPAKGKKGIDWVDFQENQFILFNEGQWVTVMPDADASNGLTCRMPGNTTQWAIQHPISKKEIIASRVDVTASIKVTADAKTGNAFTLGVYDPNTQANLVKEIILKDIQVGKYESYRLEGIELKPDMYIYVAPCNNSAVQSVDVDRIYLTKSGSNSMESKSKVTFRNPIIEKAIQILLKKEFITKEDILEIKELNLNDKELYEISDLKKFKNLEKLEMCDNYLTDLSPISNLTSLKALYASNDPFKSDSDKAKRKGKNIIRDMSFVRKLRKLTIISFNDTNMSDISFLKMLPNLEHVWLYSNPISDITPIGALKKLKKVYFYDCDITDISVCRKLPQLEGIAINCNMVKDLSPLEGCKRLSYLDAHNNMISDVTPISGLTKMIYLTLEGNKLTDVSCLADMQELRHLTLGDNSGLKDYSVVFKLKALKTLDIEYLNISEEQKEVLRKLLPESPKK